MFPHHRMIRHAGPTQNKSKFSNGSNQIGAQEQHSRLPATYAGAPTDFQGLARTIHGDRIGDRDITNPEKEDFYPRLAVYACTDTQALGGSNTFRRDSIR
ncbi:hypothetical protein MMC14_005551 [Varicellaria rhodocarpa]|nr:hypothetical protein [Varicellaria rhodocarpa]